MVAIIFSPTVIIYDFISGQFEIMNIEKIIGASRKIQFHIFLHNFKNQIDQTFSNKIIFSISFFAFLTGWNKKHGLDINYLLTYV